MQGGIMSVMSRLTERCGFLRGSGARLEPFPVDAWTDPAYQKWHDAKQVSTVELEGQKTKETLFDVTFSIIVPLFQTPREFLYDMAKSVLSQTYSKYELILVNASPEDCSLKSIVRELCETDARVREVILDGNYGITENTNRGIELATGEFVCFLDHDDFLEPNALFEYANVIKDDLETDVLYCDEDMVEVSGETRCHLQPLFKPAYSPELLLCKNYVIHFMAIRRSVVEAIPRPVRTFDGSQDYNMLLQAAERARSVHHVSKVLYHWRISDNSTATNPDSKPYTRRSNRLAIQGHIERMGEHASIFSSGISNLHNLWFGQIGEHLVSVIVVQTGSDEQLCSCLESFVQSNSYEHCELIVVSDHKPSLTFRRASYPVKYVTAPEHGPSGRYACFNCGARAAIGEYLLFLDDTLMFLTPEPLEQLLGLCSRDGVGAVSSKILYAGGEVRYYGIAVTHERIMPMYRGYPDDFPGYLCNIRCFQNVSAASYECMLTPRESFASVGGFDDSYRGVIGSVDYCRRLRDHGCRIVQTPTVKAESMERCPADRYNNISNSPEFFSDDIELYRKNWPDAAMEDDPYFNKNLDQGSCYMQVQPGV